MKKLEPGMRVLVSNGKKHDFAYVKNALVVEYENGNYLLMEREFPFNEFYAPEDRVFKDKV